MTTAVRAHYADKPHDPWWPVPFDAYNFDARCYNTLRCSVLFMNHQHITTKTGMEPSGQPYSPDWKDHWEAGFGVMDKMDVPMPPVEVDWTALDGVERSAVVELDKIFRDRAILHNIAREDVDENWAINHHHRAEILLEVNDRTINVYMKAQMHTKLHPSYPETHGWSYDLVLAWTRTY